MSRADFHFPARRYDRNGKAAVLEAANAVDPATVFGMAFGSDVFEDYVGQLALATLASLGYEGGGDPRTDSAFHAKLQALQQVGGLRIQVDPAELHIWVWQWGWLVFASCGLLTRTWVWC